MLKFACFVSGTDTEIGKTHTTLGLMEGFKGRGLVVAGMKPVASGGEILHGQLVNEDGLKIRAACSRAVDYALINPYVMPEAIAPHIAAQKASQAIRLAPIVEAYQALSAQSEVLVVEGVGGWRVPLGEGLQTTDLVRALSLPVVLTVGLRLGCINHALLSAEAILADGHRLLGWVANSIDPAYKETQAMIETIDNAIPAPLLGHIPHRESFDAAELADAFAQQVFRLEGYGI